MGGKGGEIGKGKGGEVVKERGGGGIIQSRLWLGVWGC